MNGSQWACTTEHERSRVGQGFGRHTVALVQRVDTERNHVFALCAQPVRCGHEGRRIEDAHLVEAVLAAGAAQPAPAVQPPQPAAEEAELRACARTCTCTC